MLANTNGQGLKDHLTAVASMAREMGKKLGVADDLLDDIYTAALLHDIGKVDPLFQKHLMTKVDTAVPLIIDGDFPADPIENGYPLHHETGWAYLTEVTENERVLNAVYWHHARPIHTVDQKFKIYECAHDIKELSSTGFNALKEFLNELKPLAPPAFFGNVKHGRVDVPDLFKKDDGGYLENAEFMLVRACVISADRFVSSLTPEATARIAMDDTDVTDIVNSMLTGSINGKITLPTGYDEWRFNLQKEIVEEVGDSRTAIIKAPAGLGKTLIGLLWSKSQKGKVIWVCPRNAVADAVYENIIKEIHNLELDCSVEIFRTGKRQATNRENDRPEFSSDIIVTNIDALMSPMINNMIAHRLFTVYAAHVVLDEFHEFVSDAPLFAAFITYMRARHRVAKNCKTLLLSATPSLVHILWDSDERQSLLLPNKTEHYPPQHSGKYAVYFANNFPPQAKPGSVLVCNSVSEAQNNYKSGGYTQIIHHRYTDADRKKKETLIKTSFGKNGTGVMDGESLSAALVVQAAMDISFRDLFDSVCSPESTLQRIGRTDRWGSFQSLKPSITFMDISSEKTESGAINTVYDSTLQKNWFKFLEEKLAGVNEVSLATMYLIYNEYYQIHANEIKRYLLNQYKSGMNGPRKDLDFLGLIKFSPVKYLNYEPEKKDKAAYKNLRCPDGSYFYTVQLAGQLNTWLAPEDVMSEGFELHQRFEKPELFTGLNEVSTMQARLKGLVACGYAAWTKHSKGKMKIPAGFDWFKKARNPATPLPDFSRRYDREIGLINK